uniref:Uncharacterized protein n=1 Tax=Anguilla anguilla TaxID=7936 RepID=A0A0E9UM91_ANGAN
MFSNATWEELRNENMKVFLLFCFVPKIHTFIR